MLELLLRIEEALVGEERAFEVARLLVGAGGGEQDILLFFLLLGEHLFAP